MASVDNRIVNMQFNNADFERKIAGTLKSLQGLDKAIATSGAGGLAGLEKSVGRFNLNPMTSAIEGVSAKFLALSTIGITALANITNRAVDAGIQLGKSLSLDQVIDGFKEYELNINSIQTILANTRRDGTTLTEVNAALDELNEYSDQTIYNFAQMTKNIGAATAAGVDLDTAVTYVKGFANSAAVAGVDATSMAGALEQMSQALAAGTVRAQDWISLERRGLAGQVQQEAFFNMAKAMGTMADVPIDQSFEEWTDAGNTLRASLQEGWLTADVFLNTMGAFAGEMDEAKLSALGFTDEMIPQMLELGEVGIESATKIRTMTQLLDVARESVASGWSQSFRTIFGDFEEATELFSGLGNAITGMIDNSSQARNDMLNDWAELGGRAELIEGLRLTFVNLGKIFAPIREAFREIFPRRTGEDLFELTVRFREFAESLEPSERTLENLGRIFKGVFNVIGVAIELFKTLASAIGEFVQEFTGLGSGNTLGFLAEIGDALATLTPEDVIGSFKNFVDELSDLFENPIPYIQNLWDTISEFFSNISVNLPDIPALSGPLDVLAERFGAVKSIFESIGDFFKPVADAFGRVKDAFVDMKDFVSDAFSEFFDVVDEAARTGDYDKVSDAISIGLLAAIGLGIKKFLNKGIGVNLDFGGGVLSSLKKSLEGLTGVFSAMQTSLKADALQKIGYAIATITASVLVLSLIDSDALAKALTAMSVGFAQLLGAFAILQKITLGPASAAQFIALSAGLTLLAGASLLLAASARIMAGLDWEELARGLTGVVGILGAMVVTVKLLSGNTGTLYSAGGGMILIGSALLVFASAMRLMSGLDWEELAKGFTGTIGGLIGIGTAMKFFPADMAARSAGIFTISASLLLLGAAMKILSTLSWEEIAKGLVGVGVGLAGMGKAFRLFPKDLSKIGGTLLLVGIALILLAKSMEKLAQISWPDIAKGLISITVALTIIGVAMKALSGSLVGSIGLILLANGLSKLATVIETFANLGITTLVVGLLALVAVLGAVAGVSYLIAPAIVPMLGLGAALFLIGAGVAAFGTGLGLAIGAFATLASIGPGVGKVIIETMEAIGAALPALVRGFAEGLIELGIVLLEAAPPLVEKIAELIVTILDKLIELMPEISKFINELVMVMVESLSENGPKLIDAGITLLLDFLQGIRDNIAQVTELSVEILAGLIEGVANGIPELVDSLVLLIGNALTSVAQGLGELVPTIMVGLGISFLKGFWEGLKKELGRLKDLVFGMVEDIIDWVKSGFGIASPSRVMEAIGVDIILGMIKGVTEQAVKLFNWFVALPSEIVKKIGDVGETLLVKGINFISGLKKGVEQKWKDLATWLGGLALRVSNAIGDVATYLVTKGINFLVGLKNGMIDKFNDVRAWVGNIPSRILGMLSGAGDILVGVGKSIINGLWKGMKNVWDNDVTNWLSSRASKIINLKGPPAKDKILLVENGELIMQGLRVGMEKQWDTTAGWLSSLDPATEMNTDAMARAIDQAYAEVVNMTDMQPSITPVMDLSQVRAGAKELNGLVGASSTANASLIASSPSGRAAADATSGTGEMSFTQINQSPKALSTADIYRQTRNQIAMAKEELDIS